MEGLQSFAQVCCFWVFLIERKLINIYEQQSYRPVYSYSKT